MVAPEVPLAPVIPGLVPGIRQRRVGGAEGSFHTKDFAWLDPCDKHRDDGICSKGATNICRLHVNRDS
ncbi:hypothetical protein E2F50_05335 [Rhizobium deserti]|uniref:Uncharacterized protein n=1 Tax=Rhizobium deserti TaxID=2547961 RepID=A0A4R5UPQ6_9HYPH|nr:hypothetical protein E2F50_05335 [Rhizobium deserti]